MSSKPAVESSAASSVIVDAIIKYFNINMGLLDIVTTVVRKSAHFTEYFILSALLVNTYKAFRGEIINFYFTLLICLIQGNLDEFLQKFIDGRSSEVRDVLIDFSGALLFVIIYNAYKFIKNKSHRKTTHNYD